MGWLGTLFGFLRLLWGILSGKRGATLAEVADSNARAQERLDITEKSNEVIDRAAGLRRDAADRIVRGDSEGKEDDRDAYWRD